MPSSIPLILGSVGGAGAASADEAVVWLAPGGGHRAGAPWHRRRPYDAATRVHASPPPPRASLLRLPVAPLSPPARAPLLRAPGPRARSPTTRHRTQPQPCDLPRPSYDPPRPRRRILLRSVERRGRRAHLQPEQRVPAAVNKRQQRPPVRRRPPR